MLLLLLLCVLKMYQNENIFKTQYKEEREEFMKKKSVREKEEVFTVLFQRQRDSLTIKQKFFRTI